MPSSCRPTEDDEIELAPLLEGDAEERRGGNSKNTSPLND
jgi:hypothetical protein